MARSYEPNQKHKWPKGFGSLCPHPFPEEVAQELLERAVLVEGSANKLWAASGRWCFCGHPTRREDDVWHGFPVIGGEVPERVLAALENAGLITREQRRRLRRQRALPSEWP